MFGNVTTDNRIVTKTEYRVYYSDGNIDHVSRKEALDIVERRPEGVDAAYRVVRKWYTDGQLISETEYELLVIRRPGED